MSSLRAAVARLCLVSLCALALAAPVAASPATLRRSLGNLVFAPLDLALSPFVATGAVVQNLSRTQDSSVVRVLYFLPGVAWNTGVQAGASAVRELAGLLEMVPGLVLLPFERDLPPLFEPAEGSPAWVDWETRPLHVRIGVDYTVLATPE
jgi:hypothetical protein